MAVEKPKIFNDSFHWKYQSCNLCKGLVVLELPEESSKIQFLSREKVRKC